jgi:hypothetical protein
VIDKRLIRRINNGHCFALVGSGLSAEMGYPSWSELAKTLVDSLKQAGKVSDQASYDKYLEKKEFPELFRQAERDLASRDALIKVLQELVVPKNGGTHHAYDLLTDWPFACYLTTNWDDEISNLLRIKGVYFTTLQNTRADFVNIRQGAANLIVKLHSDLAHPDLAVITSTDYQRVSSLPAWDYFRDRLRAIFQMFDIFVVGHSLTDPDLRLILDIAKEAASPSHPLFMIMANITKAEEHEWFERFNIVAWGYEDTDGTHLRLRRILSVLNDFIVPRRQRFDLHELSYSPGELEAAQAMAIYRRFATGDDADTNASEYLGPLILHTLFSSGLKEISLDELLKMNPLATALRSESTIDAVPGAIAQLESRGFVISQDGVLHLTEVGQRRAEERSQLRAFEEDQAYGQFLTDVAVQYNATAKQQERLVELLRGVLITAFRQRGLSIAKAVFTNSSIEHDTLNDLFSSFSSAASSIEESDLSLTFVDAAQRFILRPSLQQKQYLASLSQGFFAYHLFGLDPTCARIRREVFEHTIWWCDSHILIALLAIGSENHQYAKDLFSRLKKLKAFTLTTTRLIREVFQHLDWFIRLAQREKSDSPRFLEAAVAAGGYKQNLFLDGFIRSTAGGDYSNLSAYFGAVVPYGATEAGVAKLLKNHGIQVLNIEELKGFDLEHTREMLELTQDISEARSRTGTLRSPLQVEAEAEILVMIQKVHEGVYTPPIENATFDRCYFLSQSRVLDKISPLHPVSWTPEALYRFIAELPGEQLDPELLYRCMLQEFFASGIEVIDTPRYEKFFGSIINVAKTTYAKERDGFLQEFPDKYGESLDRDFESIPDLEKPFFVEQMGWKVARRQEAKAHQTEQQLTVARRLEADARAEITKLRQELDSDWKRRKAIRAKQVEAENRNAQDEKHRRKRLRQAKARQRKG